MERPCQWPEGTARSVIWLSAVSTAAHSASFAPAESNWPMAPVYLESAPLASAQRPRCAWTGRLAASGTRHLVLLLIVLVEKEVIQINDSESFANILNFQHY